MSEARLQRTRAGYEDYVYQPPATTPLKWDVTSGSTFEQWVAVIDRYFDWDVSFPIQDIGYHDAQRMGDETI